MRGISSCLFGRRGWISIRGLQSKAALMASRILEEKQDQGFVVAEKEGAANVVTDSDEEEAFDFTIQEASLESDLEQIIEVINRAYQRQLFNRPGTDRIYLFQLKEILLNPNKQLFVLYCADRICGTILVSQSEIFLFSIHPDFQGQGYGKWLLLMAEKEILKLRSCLFKGHLAVSRTANRLLREYGLSLP